MTPLAEPLPLRVSRDVLVLQPMHGHLDLEPMLLQPGLRCSIGSAEHCVMRLPTSTIVHAEHCVIEVVGRKTLLTQWADEATWLNDRVVTEPRELVPGDRVAVGPFDFRVRSASPDELLYAKLVERKPDEEAEVDVDNVVLLKQALDVSGRERVASNKVLTATRSPVMAFSGGHTGSVRFRELLREASEAPRDPNPERLTQHISKLLGNLQNQVNLLQEKETELQEQLQQHRTDLADLPAAVASPGSPAERAILERERILAAEQAQCETLRQKSEQRLRELEATVRDFEGSRAALRRDQAACHKLSDELIRKQQMLANWEERLRAAKLTPSRELETAPRHPDEQPTPSVGIERRDPTNEGSTPSERIDSQHAIPTPVSVTVPVSPRIPPTSVRDASRTFV